MRQTLFALLVASWLIWALPAAGQQVCPGLPYLANTPEDELMQEVNGAENPQEQIDALDKFSQAHPDSKFLPCVHEYFTLAYLKLNNYDKVVEYGEKGLAGDYTDMMLILNTLKGYVASGKSSDTAFKIVMKAPAQIKEEANPTKPPNVSDAEWEKALKDYAAQAEDERVYVVYAFFQLLPRVTDAQKRLEYLDTFSKDFPDAQTKDAVKIYNGYFEAYRLANNLEKTLEYGEKSVAADPNNVGTLNALAYLYAFVSRNNIEKADAYAKKALALAEAMKKPEGAADADFTRERNTQLGMAHLNLGDVEFVRAGKTRRVGPAIEQLKTAAELLEVNPELQCQALFYLGSAYEFAYPANHRAAIEALNKASNLPGPWQGQARELLAKVRRAVGE
jgi:tetratricopeptide (TPR) repeat protein